MRALRVVLRSMHSSTLKTHSTYDLSVRPSVRLSTLQAVILARPYTV